jgi:hypothetical protein
MKNLTRPWGMAAIFHDAIRINILHSASPLNPWIQVRSVQSNRAAGLSK